MTINKKSNGDKTKGRHKWKAENIQRMWNDLLPANWSCFPTRACIYIYRLCGAEFCIRFGALYMWKKGSTKGLKKFTSRNGIACIIYNNIHRFFMYMCEHAENRNRIVKYVDYGTIGVRAACLHNAMWTDSQTILSLLVIVVVFCYVRHFHCQTDVINKWKWLLGYFTKYQPRTKIRPLSEYLISVSGDRHFLCDQKYRFTRARLEQMKDVHSILAKITYGRYVHPIMVVSAS